MQGPERITGKTPKPVINRHMCVYTVEREKEKERCICPNTKRGSNTLAVTPTYADVRYVICPPTAVSPRELRFGLLLLPCFHNHHQPSES